MRIGLFFVGLILMLICESVTHKGCLIDFCMCSRHYCSCLVFNSAANILCHRTGFC